jgi:hypothetical protein
MGDEPPDVIARHVARYDRAVELAGRTGGVWWDVACGTGYGAELLPGDDVAEIAGRLSAGGVLVLSCPIGNGTNSVNPWHIHEPTQPELRSLLLRHFMDISLEVEHYESTSGPAIQAWAIAGEPR